MNLIRFYQILIMMALMENAFSNLTVTKNTQDDKHLDAAKQDLTGSAPQNYLSRNQDVALPITLPDVSSIPRSSTIPEKSETPLKDKSIVELDQLYVLPNSWMDFPIENSKSADFFYILEMKGMADLQIDLIVKETNARLLSGTLFINSITNYTIIPFDGILIDDDIKRVLRIKKKGMMSSEVTFKMTKKENLVMDFNTSYKIITSFCSEIRIKVQNAKKFLTPDKTNRLQFLLQTSTDQHFEGEEELDMYINKSSSFPTPDKYEMRASGSLGTGLVKTVSKSNPLYCIEEGCEYNVAIVVLGINEITFFPTVFANGSIIKFHNNMFLIEEIEADEVVSYVLEVPQIEGNWVFTITPSENSPSFFINPDTMPASVDQYLYKGTSTGPQEIIITNLESKLYGFTYTKFFVTFTSAVKGETTTFRFEAKRFHPNDRKYLKPNFYESGLAAEGEVINYFLQIKSDEPESHSIIVSLDSYQGKAILYVKECQTNEANCQINEKDVQNSFETDYLKYYPGRIFRFSAASGKGVNPHTSEILLNFNCLGHSVAFYDEIVRSYPDSNSCTFAIGVYNNQTGEENKMGLAYGLLTKGMNILKALHLRSSTNVIVTKNERVYYEIPLESREEKKFLKIKIVALTGSAKFYFSKYNENPNDKDFEAKLEINKTDFVSLHSKAYSEYLYLGDFQGERVFLSIHGKEYSVLDIYVDLSLDDVEDKKTEYLIGQKILHRQIVKESAVITDSNQLIYYEDFAFKFNKASSKFEYLQIKIDSHAFGMEICVQNNREKVDQSKKCDFLSSTEQLKIERDPRVFVEGNTLAVSVRMKSQYDGFLNFPINFTILIENDDKFARFALHRPGLIHSREISPGGQFYYQIDVTLMTFRSIVLFTTETPNLECKISYNREFDKPVSLLGHENFAFEFKNMKNFKLKHCKSKSCFIYAIINNKGDKKESFSLTYSIDGMPFVLKEGEELFVPAPIPNYFVFSHVTSKPVNFNFASEVTSLVGYAMVTSKSSDAVARPFNYLNEKKFTYKTNIDRNAQMIITQEDLAYFKDAVCVFHTIPKFDFNDVEGLKESIEYDKTALLRVIAHSGIQKLVPFQQTEAHINKGDFKDFSISLKPPKKFSILLSLSSGDADLYINPGHFNLTTTKHYWMKSSVKKGDELVVEESMFEGKMPENFTVGVRGNEYSAFSLIFSPDSGNIIRLKYQTLTDVKIKKDQLYYFDFLNTKNSFNSILYASESDVEVAVLEYGKTKLQNFYDVIQNDSSYLQKFTFKKGDIPRKKFSETTLDLDTHYVIRMKAVEADTDINFLIYDKTKPIYSAAEKRFHFALDKEDSQIFAFRLDSEYKEVDVDLKMSFGNMEFAVSDTLDRFEDFKKVTKSSQVFKSLYVDKHIDKSNDLVIFKEIFVKVKAWEFSKFSILLKPFDKFRPLKENESELIHTSPEKDLYLYYEISKSKLKSIQTLNIDIYTEQYYTAKPELLYIPEQDFTLNKNSAFIPMDVLDYFETSTGEQRHIIIKPKLSVGNFIIKIAKQSEVIPLKFLISINNVRHIEVNGYYKGRANPLAPSHKDEYSVFLPSAGEFRILPDTCSHFEISHATFYEDNKEHELVFETNYNQGYDFITVDETQEKVERTLRLMELPIRRGIVNGNGVLKFSVVAKHDYNFNPVQQTANIADLDYFLISEFRPENKELIMKDYVNLWGSEGAFANIQFKHVYQNGRLEIDSRFPNFRDQLLLDYPGIKRIFVKFDFYLMQNHEFYKELKTCGFSALNANIHIKHSLERIIKKEEINRIENDVKFYFSKEELRTFNKSPSVTVFSKLSINFIENEEDEYNISLNKKFTEIPFFVLTIKNDEFDSNVNWLFYLLVIVMVLVFLYVISNRRDSSGFDSGRTNIQYQRGDEGQGTKIEMSG